MKQDFRKELKIVLVLFLIDQITLCSYNSQKDACVTALPELKFNPLGTGFQVVLDARIEYPTLAKSLNNALKGKRYYDNSHNKYIEIQDASIYGIGSNHLVLALSFDGTAKGKIYFIGKPNYNELTQIAYVSNLDFDVYTKNILLKMADWLYHKSLIDFLEANTKFDVTDTIKQAKKEFQTGLNRKVNDHLEMNVAVKDVQGVGIFASADVILVRLRVDGTAKLMAR